MTGNREASAQPPVNTGPHDFYYISTKDSEDIRRARIHFDAAKKPEGREERAEKKYGLYWT